MEKDGGLTSQGGAQGTGGSAFEVPLEAVDAARDGEVEERLGLIATDFGGVDDERSVTVREHVDGPEMELQGHGSFGDPVLEPAQLVIDVTISSASSVPPIEQCRALPSTLEVSMPGNQFEMAPASETTFQTSLGLRAMWAWWRMVAIGYSSSVVTWSEHAAGHAMTKPCQAPPASRGTCGQRPIRHAAWIARRLGRGEGPRGPAASVVDAPRGR